MSPDSAQIKIDGLSKRFHRSGGEEVLAIDDVSLAVAPGEFLVLLGPSGCGKTTLLRCLAGLEHPDQGRIHLDGRLVYSSSDGVNLPPERRRAAMLFQSYALWPHMTVFDNVAYPLRTKARGERPDKRAIRQRVEQALAVVHCDHLADQHPGQVSGGQQQRVALARALVRNDSVVFFDEPLSNVDAQLREELRVELRLLQESIGFSAIYVTHDQAEALALGDRIAVLRDGSIAQLGSPSDVYARPASGYVARFMGAVNEFPGTITEVSARSVRVRTEFGDATVPVWHENWSVGDGVILMCRPSFCRITDTRSADAFSIPASIRTQLFLGTHVEVVLEAQGTTCRVWLTSDPTHSTESRNDDSVWLTVPQEAMMLVADDGQRR